MRTGFVPHMSSNNLDLRGLVIDKAVSATLEPECGVPKKKMAFVKSSMGWYSVCSLAMTEA